MKWVTVWGNATSIAERKPAMFAKDITLRYPVTCAFGGSKLRLHFSNFCGTQPITLTCVTVAKSTGTRSIAPDTASFVTFDGKESVTIPQGQELFSDEMDYVVLPSDKLAVSFYLGDYTDMRSGVVITGPLSGGSYAVGNGVTEDFSLEGSRSTDTYYFLTGVDLYTEEENRCVACYGDSITAQAWPDDLAQLCMKEHTHTAIVRRAASGTRILREYTCLTYESYGLKGEHRFEREMSTLSGCDTVIIQQGINDIIHPVGVDVNPFRPMSDMPTVEQLEDGIEYYLSIARKLRLKTLVGTLLPIEGWRTYAPFREEFRVAFNEWILHKASCDGTIDFASALADRRSPAAFAQGYDSGDHLHPSLLAYQRMAEEAFKKL